jgi:hypothetical protein
MSPKHSRCMRECCRITVTTNSITPGLWNSLQVPDPTAILTPERGSHHTAPNAEESAVIEPAAREASMCKNNAARVASQGAGASAELSGFVQDVREGGIVGLIRL